MWPFKTVEEKNEIKREFQTAADIYLKHRENIEEFLIECDLQCFKHISRHRLLNPFVMHWISNKKLFGINIMNSIPGINIMNSIPFLLIGIGFLSWLPIPFIISFTIFMQFTIFAFQIWLFICGIKISSLLSQIEMDKIRAEIDKIDANVTKYFTK